MSNHNLTPGLRESLREYLEVLDNLRDRTENAPSTLVEFISVLTCGEIMASVPPDARFDAGMAVGAVDVIAEMLGTTPAAVVRLIGEASFLTPTDSKPEAAR